MVKKLCELCDMHLHLWSKKTMETVYINSPLGITKIIGDERQGISVISVSDIDSNEISKTIPDVLKLFCGSKILKEKNRF